MALRILLVEDEYLIALDEMATLTDMGAQVIGPASTLETAMNLARERAFDAAVLDARLGAESIHPVAELLERKGVPFIFAVGNKSDIDGRWPGSRILLKPFSPEQLRLALQGILKTRPARTPSDSA